MTWETLDWTALDRLRDAFLTGTAARGPYWQNESDLATYDLTFAKRIGWKWDALLRELQHRNWTPRGRLLVDYGCGSGIAARRVLSAFAPDTFDAFQLWDHSPAARAFALQRAHQTHPHLPAQACDTPPHPDALPAFTLVVSHVLNELSPPDRDHLLHLARAAEDVLWIEPGTHPDSRSLAKVRDTLVTTTSHTVVAPCTHRETCPLFQAAHERDWCHFFATPPSGVQNDSHWVRFAQRVGIDLRSQAYSCLVLQKRPETDLPPGVSRVLGRPEIFKPYARLFACSAEGLHHHELPKRVAPDLIKRLDRRPPIPLYHLTPTAPRLTAATPLYPATPME